MHYTPQATALVLVGFALAATRLLTASKPFWNLSALHTWGTTLAPAILVGLGTLPQALANPTSWTDVAVAVLVAVGAGFAAAHGDKAPSAATLVLLLVLCIPLQACNGVNWPKVLQCAEPLAQAELAAVQRILAGNGDATAELADLAKAYAPGTIECAVQSVVSDLSARKGAARDNHALERGRAFLAKVTR